MTAKPRHLGELDPALHAPLSVRDEIRRNLIAAMRKREPLFPGIVGYEDTVEPQIVNALLARHDLILLGLRGQAKTRICRLLTQFLDDEVPVIPGSALREHPLAPITRASIARIEEEGASMPIEWIPREERYAEKLATPDVTMADLIGDIDPLKAAHRKLDLSDEEVINFGIIPRSNRGVFTVNEIPDLAPRIQVGLLNILEEQDVQIRGFPLRIPLDVLMVFSANPEDYTNRGSIITPLKDRIASQILTHYPRSRDDAKVISAGESWLDRGDDLSTVNIPGFVEDIVEEVAFVGRESEYVDQTSGVSARLSIAARELLVSQVERRIATGCSESGTARLIDLSQVVPAITGKVELVYEGEQEGAITVARHLVGKACANVFDSLFPDVMREGSEPQAQNDRYKPVLDWFASGKQLELSDDMDDEAFRTALESVPGLKGLAAKFVQPEEGGEVDLAELSAAMELVLEGLHQHSLLAKEDVLRGVSYSDMLGVMMEGLQ
ncbi:MAG: magnesium chelatase [Planctomycetota bacterium]